MTLRTCTRSWLALLAACTGFCCAITSHAQIAIPINDKCGGAIALPTNNTSVIGNNATATAVDDGPPAACGATSNFRGVWYTFVPPATGLYQVSACHSFFDTVLQVFSAVDCSTYLNGGFVKLPGGCNDDQCGGGPGPGGTGTGFGSVISNLRLTGGVTYWIRLSGFSASGWYQLGVYSYGGSGACCANNGVCTIATASSCPSIDGTFLYMGDASLCTPNPCVGACCNNTTSPFSCTVTPPGTANTQCGLGVWQGFGSTCAVNPCPTGTCCSATGGCTITLQRSCVGTSAWNGLVTSCSPASAACYSMVAACCSNTDGSCYFGPLPCGAGTTSAGPGSVCSPSPCALGACCSSGAACTLTVAANCTGSSRWLSGVASCLPSPCTFACCDTTGTTQCITVTATSCPTGFTSQQIGTSCSPNPCASGACCSTAGGCSVTVSNNCAALNDFKGSGTTCSSSPCVTGACCSSAGACTVTAQFGCAGTNIWLGAAVPTCTPTTLCQTPTLMGACCSTAGTCTATTPAGCVGQNTFTGPGGAGYTGGTACTSTTFCQSATLMGTCCSSTGTCSITTALGCIGTSVFQGLGTNYTAPGTACTVTTFCQNTLLLGACCSSSGICTATTRTGCTGGLGASGSSQYLGEGVSYTALTACNPTTACQTAVILGSCCSATGGCTITTSNGCLFPSVWQGAGVNYTAPTTCTVLTFCQSAATMGACCSSGGICTATTAATCVAPSVFSGAGVGYTAGTVVCSPTTFCQTAANLGTCCSSGGVCSVTTALGCVGTSVYAGVGVNYNVGTTTCTSTTFCNTGATQVLGACCTAAGTCSTTTPANCIFPNTYTAVGTGTTAGATTCTPTTFCQTLTNMGACCSATGTCTATTLAGCAAPGTFQGVGNGYAAGTVVCTPTTYCNTGGTASIGACCSANGTCTVNTAAGCAQNTANTFAGVGNGLTAGACTAGFCAATLGSCCQTSGGCLQTTANGCLAPKSFGTVGTACTPTNPCGGSCCNATTFACTTAVNTAGCGVGNTFATGGLCTPGLCLVGVPNACENFDGVVAPALPAGWSTSVATGVGAPWATGTPAAGLLINSAPNAVFTNDIATVSDQLLLMPSVTAAGNLVLDFFSSYSTETNFDGWVVEVSINGGAFADVGSAAWSLNGYNATISGAFLNPIAGRPAFSGNAAAQIALTEHTCSIPAVAGNTVVIRFRMASDNSASSLGVALDNICVYNILVGFGACCASNNTCTVTNACTSPSLFQGIGTACTGPGATCPNPTSACCNNTSGACIFTNGATCPAGSTSQGTFCSPSPCLPSGICCDNTSGACAAIFGGVCAATATAGTGTVCSPGTPSSSCSVSATCCNSSSCVCTVIYGGTCPAGTGTGTGTSCTPTTCPVTLICCNSTTFVCTTLCSGTCPAGTVAGNGTSCTAAGSCAFGACCNGCAGCTIGTAASCTSGTYAGDGSTCAVACPNAGPQIATGPGTYLAGTTNIGNACDDCVTAVALPFPITFYGGSFSTGNASSNGNFQFAAATSTAFTNACLPTATFGGATIFPFWDDQRTDVVAGAGIFTATTGVTPARTFVIEWRTYYFTGTAPAAPTLNYEIIFYEGQSFFDIVYNSVAVDNCSATIGIQANGTAGSPFAQFACNTAGGATCPGQVSSGLSLRVDCRGACCSGTGVCSVTSPSNCGAGSTFQGAGSSCTPTTCVPPGICCRGSTCNATITTAAACTASLVGGQTAGASFPNGAACNVAGNNTTPCCYADYNKLNGIGVPDIFDFLADWFAGSNFANTGGNGAPAALAVQNIFDFLAAWFAGGC